MQENIRNKHLSEINTEDLKKILFRSRNIYIIIVIVILVTLFWLYNFVNYMEYAKKTLNSKKYYAYNSVDFVSLSLLILNMFVLIGLIKRTKWGRILGIISCVILCLDMPIGSIMGIWGIFILSKSKNLFGLDRILHKDITTEFKYRMAQNIQ